MRRIIAVLLALSLLFALCACGHKHTWSEATCTEPQTCSECGKTQGEALGHETAWTVSKNATLLSEGEETLTCSRCGETFETKTIEKKTTEFKDGVFHFSPEDFVECYQAEKDLKYSLAYRKCEDELVKRGKDAYCVFSEEDEKVLSYLSFEENASGEIEAIYVQGDFFDGLNIAVIAFNYLRGQTAGTDSVDIQMYLLTRGERKYQEDGIIISLDDQIDSELFFTITGE